LKKRFLDNGTNSCSRVYLLIHVLVNSRHCCVNNNNKTMIYSEEDKVFIKILHQEGVMQQKILSNSSWTKTGLCRLWRRCWQRLIKPLPWIANPTVVKRTTQTNKFARMFCANLLRITSHRTHNYIRWNFLAVLGQWMIAKLLCC